MTQYITTEDAIRVQEALMQSAIGIVVKKRKDYSSVVDPLANLRMAKLIGLHPVTGVLLRMMDKLSRMKSLNEKDYQNDVGGETCVDTIIDIINYACILGCLVYEEHPEFFENFLDKTNPTDISLEDVGELPDTTPTPKSPHLYTKSPASLSTGTAKPNEHGAKNIVEQWARQIGETE